MEKHEKKTLPNIARFSYVSPNLWEDYQELSELFAHRFSVAHSHVTGSKETPFTKRVVATSIAKSSRKELCAQPCLQHKHQTPVTCDQGHFREKEQ